MSEKMTPPLEADRFWEMYRPANEYFEQAMRPSPRRTGAVEAVRAWEIKADELPCPMRDLFPEYFPKSPHYGQPGRREMLVVAADGVSAEYFDIKPSSGQYSRYKIEPVSDPWGSEAVEVDYEADGYAGDAKLDEIELKEGQMVFARNTYNHSRLQPRKPYMDLGDELSQSQASAFGILDRCGLQAEAKRREEPFKIAAARFFGNRTAEPDLSELENLEGRKRR